MVLATQNPFEFEGTYPLPESQLDRFLLRLALDIRIGIAERRTSSFNIGPASRSITSNP